MNVIVSMDHNPCDLDPSRIQRICEFALCESGAPAASEVSVSFVDDGEMATLNE